MRRSDSIRTRHLGGIVAGTQERPGLFVTPASDINTREPERGLFTPERAAANGLVTVEQIAEMAGRTVPCVRHWAHALGLLGPVLGYVDEPPRRAGWGVAQKRVLYSREVAISLIDSRCR